MLNRKTVLVYMLLSSVVFSPMVAHAAVPYISGSFQTPTQQGPLKFTPVKRVIQFGYQGTVRIGGKNYPGVMYLPRTGAAGTVGLAWYFGNSGITAGNAIATVQPDGVTYTGTVWFYDRNGNTIDSGTVTFQ